MADVINNRLKDIRDSEKFPPKGFNSANYPREASGTITSAEILALNTTPKVLISGAGEGSYIIAEEAVFFLDFTDTAYAGSGGLSIRYTNASGDTLFNALPEVAFLEATADSIQVIAPIDCVPVSGASVVLCADTADPTDGDSVIKWKIKYRVVTF